MMDLFREEPRRLYEAPESRAKGLEGHVTELLIVSCTFKECWTMKQQAQHSQVRILPKKQKAAALQACW